MIERLSVKNFKSIDEMTVDCRRINLFIGEPNTGKSNILESLGLLSAVGHDGEFNNFLRFKGFSDIFHDSMLEENIDISARTTNRHIFTTIAFGVDDFEINMKVSTPGDSELSAAKRTVDYTGSLSESVTPDSADPVFDTLSHIKYYKFFKQNNFPGRYATSLSPPHGSNLFSILRSNKELKNTADAFFDHLDLKLMLNLSDRTLGLVKQKDEQMIIYPYITISETLQRVIFYTIAMESNTGATLVFEEPESFAFPYYTKYLGERIAFDDANQYFVSTHNPYLLLAILEKTPKKDVNVFITYLKDYKTRVRKLTEEEIPELTDSDPFFNLDLFLEEDAG